MARGARWPRGWSSWRSAAPCGGPGHAALPLFAMTVLMGAGFAVAQPTLPSPARLVRGAERTRHATYSNGLLIGEIVAAALTAPLLIGLVGGWGAALAVWSLPVALTAAAVLASTPHSAGDSTAIPARWWPDRRSVRTWRRAHEANEHGGG